MYKPRKWSPGPLQCVVSQCAHVASVLLPGQEEILYPNLAPRPEAALPLSVVKVSVLAALISMSQGCDLELRPRGCWRAGLGLFPARAPLPAFRKASLSTELGFRFLLQVVPFWDASHYRVSVLLPQACLWEMSPLPLGWIFWLKSSDAQGSYCWHFICFITPFSIHAFALQIQQWIVYSGRVVSGAATPNSSEWNVKCSPRLAKSCTRPQNGDTFCTHSAVQLHSTLELSAGERAVSSC